MATFPSFQRLPLDIQGLVLQAVPDVATLLAFIAASPEVLHIYLQHRHQIYVSVICNHLRTNLINGLLSIRPLSLNSIAVLGRVNQPTLDEARQLYRQDRLINTLIQQCVNMQLKTGVRLSVLESFRMRRGMYNYNIARLLREHDEEIFSSFCFDLPTKEILEILYVIHCLRDLAADHIFRLEDLMVEKIQDGTLQPDWTDDEPEFCYFDQYQGDDLQRDWLINAPWLLDFREFSDLTRPIALSDMERFEIDNWQDYVDQLNCDDVMIEAIPLDYRFNESSHSGIDSSIHPDDRSCYKPGVDRRPGFQEASATMIMAIPLGYMIWDETRLARTRWNDRLPLLMLTSNIQPRWKAGRNSVQARVWDAHRATGLLRDEAD